MRLSSSVFPTVDIHPLLGRRAFIRPKTRARAPFDLHSVRFQSNSKRARDKHHQTILQNLKTYSNNYVNFYKGYLANSSPYNPFATEGIHDYPCEEDKKPESRLAHNVSCEDVILPRRASGSIRLRVYTCAGTTENSPVVIYFPSRATSPIPESTEHQAISYLTRLLGSTTISVGYRVRSPFPTSLHDCMAAVDWVRENIPTVSLENYSETLSGRLIAVLGTGIGGGLAASIGITEGRESGIIAAGAWAPIVDWAFDPLPEVVETRHSTLPRSPRDIKAYLAGYNVYDDLDKVSPDLLRQIGFNVDLLDTFDLNADNPFLSTTRLQKVRARYFQTAEDYVDPFASPLYWFKSSGVNIWTRAVSMIEGELISNPDNLPEWVHKMRTEFIRTGRRSKLYPPAHLLGSLTVPTMRIVSAERDILAAQTLEFVEAARTALFPSIRKGLEDHLAEELTGPPLEDLYQQESGSKYSSGALSYIKSRVIDKAGHCFMTMPSTESKSDALEEVQYMAKWLRAIFQAQPDLAIEWRRRRLSLM